MSKRNESSGSVPSGKKRKRHAITLEQKFNVIELHERGHRYSQIGREVGMPESTVRNIIKNASEIKKRGEVVSAFCGLKTITRNRSTTMIEMERLLADWVEDCTQKNIPLNKAAIQAKALCLFKEIKESGNNADSGETFGASSGWFDRFRNRVRFYNVKVAAEATSADECEAAGADECATASEDDYAATKYQNFLKKIIEEGEYTDKQIFNVKETGLFWKRLPSGSHVYKKENTQLELEASRDRLTLLLGGNAEGDFKLKPMLIYWSQNPQALRNFNIRSLPVFWRSNRKACMTKTIFEDWFSTYFCPAVEKYCRGNGIPFKALLILDNATGHPTSLNSLCENVKVIFLPSNITLLLQPMDQGIIAFFKACYLRKTFEQAFARVSGDHAISASDFWESYNIKDAIENIHYAWQQMSTSDMRAMWKRTLPQCRSRNFKEFSLQHQTAVIDEITNIGRSLGFEQLESDYVWELLDSHSEELTDDDFFLLQQLRAFDESENENKGEDSQIKDFSLEEFEDIFRVVEVVKQKVMSADPNVDRGIQVRLDIDKAFATYQRMYEDLKKEKTIQSAMLTCFAWK